MNWVAILNSLGGGVILKGEGYVLWIHEKQDEGLKDYKIFNFDGKAKVIQVDYGRFTKHMRNLYSTQWDYIEAAICYPTDPNHEIPKPKKLEEMLALAEKLSAGIPHVRTDFYYIDDKIYFGELTFYHGSGMETFVPKEYGFTMGEYLKLPWGGVILKGEGYVLWIREKQELGLKDYKIHCFNGEPKMTLVCTDRFSDVGLCEDFFDNDWAHLPIRRPSHLNAPFDIACPKNFVLMKQLARQLSADIPFVRVDFYEIDGKVHFGELTFFPASGMEDFVPNEWDTRLGEWIKLN